MKLAWLCGFAMVALLAAGGVLFLVERAPQPEAGRDGSASTESDGPATTAARGGGPTRTDGEPPDEERFSLDKPVELPDSPDLRDPLAPRERTLPPPDPNSPDSAAEGKLL